MQIRSNFHNLCKCIDGNGISMPMVFLLTYSREHNPWIKRRKFIQRDTLYLYKLGLISIIYANLFMGPEITERGYFPK